jgi:pyruvate/2-oxoglutarate dehydrogenase complex dihydrolipoamide acyltransferase (E2) component
LTLFDKTGVKSLVDKNGTTYPIDSIFAPFGASNTWITECSDEKIIRMDLKIGVDTDYPTTDVWSSMRLIRIEGEAAPAKAGAAAPAPKAESAQPAEASTEAAKAAPAAAAPKAAGGTPKPIPRTDFSSEERAAMLKRARAHAAEVKARKG